MSSFADWTCSSWSGAVKPMWIAWIGMGSWPMQPGLPMQAGSGIELVPVHRPEKSGRPSAALGVGALRLTAPSGSLGTPGVGYFTHCAAALTDIDTVSRAIAIVRMTVVDDSMTDNISPFHTSTSV